MLIQKLRLQRGWSQEQLAELSGVSVRTIQRLEGGKPASPETLKAVASVLEVDFSRLKEPEMDTAASPAANPVRPDEALALAHVRKVRAFYMHLVQYVVICTGLAALNIVTTPGYLWVAWVILGWGLGVASHALRVFDILPFLNADWERRQVERRLGREL